MVDIYKHGPPYLKTKTKKRPVIIYRGHRYHKVFENEGKRLATAEAYAVAVKERSKRGPGSTIWTGQPGKGKRVYGVYVRSHMRKKKVR